MRVFKVNAITCAKYIYPVTPMAYVAQFYGRLRLIRSILNASKFSALKLIEILILWVYYTIHFGFSLF